MEDVYNEELTLALDNLGDEGGLLARVHRVHVLYCELGAVGRDTISARADIHGALEGVAFPTKHVVGMLSVASTMYMEDYVQK